MLKRICAAALALLLTCLCVGCGAKTETASTTAADASEASVQTVGSDDRIAILVGDETQEPELYAAVKQLAGVYGDTIMMLRYSDAYYTSSNGLTDSALAAARDSRVKALIFAGGVNGTVNAAMQAREARKDLCIIACNPLEGTQALSPYADVILSVDFTALAKDLVAQAKAMGAENFVFYTTDRELKLAAIRDMRKTIEQSCKAEEMTCKAASSIDLAAAGNTLETAKRFLLEDAERRADKLGKKTALFCTEPRVQGGVAAAAAQYGLVVPGTFLPSPYALAMELDADLAGHTADSAYALEQLRGNADVAGRVATWSFSAPIGLLQAAMDYALAVLAGDADQTPDAAAVERMVKAHTDDAVTVSAKDGVFLLTSDSIVL